MKKPGRRRFLPTDEDRSVADAMRLSRLEKKLSQAELGQYVGLSAATINRYEKLHRGPTAQDLAHLEAILGPLRTKEAGGGDPAHASHPNIPMTHTIRPTGASTYAIAAGAIVDGLPSDVHRDTALRMLNRYAESVEPGAHTLPAPPPSAASPSAQPGRSEPSGAARPRDLNPRSPGHKVAGKRT